jgi:hypothetical protein
MIPRLARLVRILLLAPLLACDTQLVAQLVATVDPVDGTPVQATVNFSGWSQPAATDGRLHVTFFADNGDTMDIALTPPSAGGAVTPGRYDINAGNTLEASFEVTYASGSSTVSVAAGTGYVNVTNVAVSGGTVAAFEGNFYVGFQDGGAGSGTFVAN